MKDEDKERFGIGSLVTKVILYNEIYFQANRKVKEKIIILESGKKTINMASEKQFQVRLLIRFV